MITVIKEPLLYWRNSFWFNKIPEFFSKVWFVLFCFFFSIQSRFFKRLLIANWRHNSSLRALAFATSNSEGSRLQYSDTIAFGKSQKPTRSWTMELAWQANVAYERSWPIKKTRKGKCWAAYHFSALNPQKVYF